MAQESLVHLIDDLDGSTAEDLETVHFGLDGVTYSIDLSAGNADDLRARLREFVAHARQTGGRPGTVHKRAFRPR
ncbi:Lsr2 protein [Lentzea californiensis]|nr:Lsr2 protein [Lentzea californiensis]